MSSSGDSGSGGSNNGSIVDVLSGGSANTSKYQNITLGTFFSSLGVSIAMFALQFTIFLLLKGKLPRI